LNELGGPDRLRPDLVVEETVQDRGRRHQRRQDGGSSLWRYRRARADLELAR
jgi:hypothetical protein